MNKWYELLLFILTTHPLYQTASGLPPHIHSLASTHQAHSLHHPHLLLPSVPLAARMTKCIFTTGCQQPTCDFLRWLKTPNSFQIARDGAASFEHPHQLPQPLALLLELLLLLLALLLGQARWVHAQVENFGSAGVVVALRGRNRGRLSNRLNLQVHPTCATLCVKMKMLGQKKGHVKTVKTFSFNNWSQPNPVLLLLLLLLSP